MLRASQRRLFSSSTRLAKNIYGFIGLGQMGSRMAFNLGTKLLPGDELLLHDVNAAATSKLAQQIADFPGTSGEPIPERPLIRSVRSVAELAEQADTIITMLPESSHVKSVYKEIVNALQPAEPPLPIPKLFIDSSTIDIATSADIASLVKDTGLGSFVDAPVSGGVAGAEKGTLTFMVSGEPAGAASGDTSQTVGNVGDTGLKNGALTNVLSKMGARLIACGVKPGSGLAAKLANNYLLAMLNLATSEAMAIGLHLGLDGKVLTSVINTSTGRNWCSTINNPVPNIDHAAPSSRGYAGGFGLSLMRKDLQLAIEAAEASDTNLWLGEHTLRLYKAAEQDPKCKGKDFSVLYQFLKRGDIPQDEGFPSSGEQ